MYFWDIQALRRDLSSRATSPPGIGYLSALLLVPPLVHFTVDFIVGFDQVYASRPNVVDSTSELAYVAVILAGLWYCWMRKRTRDDFLLRATCLAWPCFVRVHVVLLPSVVLIPMVVPQWFTSESSTWFFYLPDYGGAAAVGFMTGNHMAGLSSVEA